jgi:uncharacterized phage protein (TIGR02218 family)
MNYLTRPVFEFPIDWSKSVNGLLEYNLREIKIGFGPEQFAATQLHVVNGFKFEVELVTDAEIAAFDSFFASIYGNLQGFWLPSPRAAFSISGGLNSTQFLVTDQDLAATIADHPSQYIYFRKEGLTSQIAKIDAVTDLGNGSERVTLNAALNPAIDATWSAYRLHYVKLAEDTERGEFLAEGWQNRELKVAELPTEYAAAELGTQPVYLYHFWSEFGGAALQHWYFTSHYQAITSNGQVYTAKPINHSSLRQSLKADRAEVTIDALYETGHPLAQFVPTNQGLPLWVEIYEATVPVPNTTTLLFTGRVLRAPLRGKKQSAQCASILDVMGRKFPRVIIGLRCPHMLYDANTCKVNRSARAKAATLSLITSNNVIQVTGAALNGIAANWFAEGHIETGSGSTFEVRKILQSTVISSTLQELALNAPFKMAQVGQAVTVLDGCDGRYVTCRDKFANLANYGGFPFVPPTNPTIRGIPVNPTAGGGKK